MLLIFLFLSLEFPVQLPSPTKWRTQENYILINSNFIQLKSMKSYILKKKYHKKQHFQLLEIMVAMILIAACALPAMRIFTNMYRQQLAVIQDYQLDHLAHSLHAVVVEKLYRHQLPIEDLNNQPMVCDDPDILKKLKALDYHCTYQMKKRCQKKSKNKEIGTEQLIDLTLAFTANHDDNKRRQYDYILYVAGGGLPDETDEKEESEADEDGPEDEESTPC